MRVIISFVTSLGMALAGHAQGTMNIHRTNGTTTFVNMSDIDSVVHLLIPPPAVLAIFQSGGNSLNIPLADIDTITYSPGGPAGTAQVATFPIQSTGSTGVLFAGLVGAQGGAPVLERGICYGTGQLPDLLGPSVIASGFNGPFQVQLGGLLSGVTYYARAYVTNAFGTAYGNQVSFTTLSAPYLGQGITYGSMMDQDGNTYATVTIGAQEWMAENLRAVTYANGDSILHVESSIAWAQDFNQEGFWCYYNNDPNNEMPLGKLYNGYAAGDERGVCPYGWHVPLNSDWFSLVSHLGGYWVAGSALKSQSSIYWSTVDTTATNSTGFSALGAGWRWATTGGAPQSIFQDQGNLGSWWGIRDLGSQSDTAYRLFTWDSWMSSMAWQRECGMSIRCIRGSESVSALHCDSVTMMGIILESQEASGAYFLLPYSGGAGGVQDGFQVISTEVSGLTATLLDGNYTAGDGVLYVQLAGVPDTSGIAVFTINFGGVTCSVEIPVYEVGVNHLNPNLTYGAMTDHEGSTYATIAIGSQVWMAEDLRVSTYSNGDSILNVPGSTQWLQQTTGAWAYYGNLQPVGQPNGKLYNWYAVSDPRNVCPTGWHVPTDLEWQTLELHLGMPVGELTQLSYRGETQMVGGALKTTEPQYFLGGNNGASNSSGFSALGNGYRSTNGALFNGLYYNGNWWCFDADQSNTAWSRDVSYYFAGVARNALDKRFGLSVRCVQD